MIVGIGTDLIRIARIADLLVQFAPRFAHKCFTPAERERADAKAMPAKAYARLFAAKEATLKALGTGMRQGLSWQDIEIGHDGLGRPLLGITGGCATLLQEKAPGGVSCHLSMSDDGAYAVATVILETIPLQTA